MVEASYLRRRNASSDPAPPRSIAKVEGSGTLKGAGPVPIPEFAKLMLQVTAKTAKAIKMDRVVRLIMFIRIY